jgi:hypothetical protein
MTNHGTHPPASPRSPSGHSPGGHQLMMLACVIPIALLVVFLVVTGGVPLGILALATACMLTMAVMMRGMGGGRS